MPSGPMQQGTRITEERRIMGRQINSYYKVFQYEPHSRYVGESIGRSMAGIGTRTFEETPEGTRVVFQLNLEQNGLFSILAPLFVRVLNRSLSQDLSRAKGLLESGIEVNQE